MSVSEFPYPGNERNRPYRLASPMDGVALWWCVLDDDPDTLPLLAAWLSPSERARAERYGSERLAHALRARTCGAALDPRATPRRAAGARADRARRSRASATRPVAPMLDFNVSNTRDVALVGLADSPGTAHRCRCRTRGPRRSITLGLARKFLTSREQAAIASLDDDAHRRAFLRLWTCKEAMSKATGAGAVRTAAQARCRAGACACASPRDRRPTCADDWQLAAVDAPDRIPRNRRAVANAAIVISTDRAVLDSAMITPVACARRRFQPTTCLPKPDYVLVEELLRDALDDLRNATILMTKGEMGASVAESLAQAASCLRELDDLFDHDPLAAHAAGESSPRC